MATVEELAASIFSQIADGSVVNMRQAVDKAGLLAGQAGCNALSISDDAARCSALIARVRKVLATPEILGFMLPSDVPSVAKEWTRVDGLPDVNDKVMQVQNAMTASYNHGIDDLLAAYRSLGGTDGTDLVVSQRLITWAFTLPATRGVNNGLLVDYTTPGDPPEALQPPDYATRLAEELASPTPNPNAGIETLAAQFDWGSKWNAVVLAEVAEMIAGAAAITALETQITDLPAPVVTPDPAVIVVPASGTTTTVPIRAAMQRGNSGLILGGAAVLAALLMLVKKR